MFKGKVALAAIRGEKTLSNWRNDLRSLHAEIGKLALENDCLSEVLRKASLLSETMIDRELKVPIFRQSAALAVEGGSVYYQGNRVKAVPDKGLKC
jgi:hypothetical protein